MKYSELIDKLKNELGEDQFKSINCSLYKDCCYKHLKTGNEYLFKDLVLDATNETEGRIMVVYAGYTGMYCREAKEFFNKFVPEFEKLHIIKFSENEI